MVLMSMLTVPFFYGISKRHPPNYPHLYPDLALSGWKHSYFKQRIVLNVLLGSITLKLNLLFSFFLQGQLYKARFYPVAAVKDRLMCSKPGKEANVS